MNTPPSFVADRQAVIDALVAAGIDAVGDPRPVPPAVIVGVPTMRVADRTDLPVEQPIHVLAAPPGDAEALTQMLAVVADVYAALGPYDLDALPGVYPLGGDAFCPCYTITLTTTASIC